MGTLIEKTEAQAAPNEGPAMNARVRRRLGLELRAVYERSCLVEPIPDDHLELLLRLRHKERDRQRAR